MNLEYWVIAILVVFLLVDAWSSRRKDRRLAELEQSCEELEEEVRLTERKLRRAEDELRRESS